MLPKENLRNLKEQCRVLGHLSQVFCVAFDRTGRYVITVSCALWPVRVEGGDDKLIKVWDTSTGMLRYTFRGHQGEIADISINYENSALASGSTDKTVR